MGFTVLLIRVSSRFWVLRVRLQVCALQCLGQGVLRKAQNLEGGMPYSNPRPKTSNPKPEAPNPKTQTLNPEPKP